MRSLSSSTDQFHRTRVVDGRVEELLGSWQIKCAAARET
jgi:hypothetical protein